MATPESGPRDDHGAFRLEDEDLPLTEAKAIPPSAARSCTDGHLDEYRDPAAIRTAVGRIADA